VPMPDPDQVPMSGCPDANNVEILQHINAMLDNPLDLSEGLSRGPSRDGKQRLLCSLVDGYRTIAPTWCSKLSGCTI
jgi:hypothetical protein